MDKEIDILNIDLEIKKSFKDEIDSLKTYKEKFEHILKSLEIPIIIQSLLFNIFLRHQPSIHPRKRNTFPYVFQFANPGYQAF